MLYTKVNDDYISVIEDNGGDETEIVGWSVDEWTEDPTIVPSIANAVMLCYENPDGLKELLGKVGK